MTRTLELTLPPRFSFRSTVYSHGWCELAPFSLDAENWRLSYIFTQGKRTTPGVISQADRGLRIELGNSLVPDSKVITDVRHILRIDDDLDAFYGCLEGNERLSWVTEKKAGRLLRSPTVWEDLVKTICTTNCSWALTKIMVNNLVSKLGMGKDGARAFPTPEQMAAQDETFYRDEIRSGYRGPYFMELAEKVATGDLDPEAWLHTELPTPELKKEIKKVKGVGDYAAENLLKLVGRYDGLALDSWLRGQFYKHHNSGRKCKDAKIEKHYKRFGEWRGLVIWCDMTEKWHA